MRSTFITTHLVVGDPPTKVSGDIRQVQTAEQAVEVIEGGGIAVLPEGAWEVAEDVLRLFGADEKHIKFQVGTAKSPPTGGDIPSHPSASQ
jgi:hypothetical protein